MGEGLEMSRRLCDRALTGEVLAKLSSAVEFTGDATKASDLAEEALEIARKSFLVTPTGCGPRRRWPS
jgi:hypothetical protein